MVTNRRWGLAVGSALACAVVTASCSGTGTPTTGSPDSQASEVTASSSTVVTLDFVTGGGVFSDIEMFFDYPRYLWHIRRLSVATTNLGDEPITISSIALRADHFESLPAEPKRTVIAPDQRVDVQVDFGPLTTCSPSEEVTGAVAVTLARGDGPPVDHLIVLDPRQLDEIRDRECMQQRVAGVASIGFSAQRSIDGMVMETSIEVVRNTGTPVIEITSLSSSVILALVPVLRVGPDVNRASVPIRLEVSRCDPHVVSQSSRTFDLAAYVSIDGGESHRHLLEIDREMQSDLQSMIDACTAFTTG